MVVDTITSLVAVDVIATSVVVVASAPFGGGGGAGVRALLMLGCL